MSGANSIILACFLITSIFDILGTGEFLSPLLAKIIFPFLSPKFKLNWPMESLVI
ncbi:hypothetical protein [uncultured Clostridium sp.]|uniref:hypothetical protein n=1 Tax=uncultured Clostridium sp. TaxID=59620 RepID=UPI002620A558|nr:hypothetical protein [uncultured Clostridium sp.]